MCLEIWVSTTRNRKYQVSNLGRVRVIKPLNLIRILKHRLKFGKGKSPKLTVQIFTLGRPCKRHEVKISVLVLEAFIGPRPVGPVEYHASHLDDNYANNRLDNLAWETSDQNQRRRGWNMQAKGETA